MVRRSRPRKTTGFRSALQVNDDEEAVDRLLVAASDSYEIRQSVSQGIYQLDILTEGEIFSPKYILSYALYSPIPILG